MSKIEKNEIRNLILFLICPNCSFKIIYYETNLNKSKFLTCPRCSNVTCRLCKHKAHSGMPCYMKERQKVN